MNLPEESQNATAPWWDWGLLARWVVISVLAYAVVIVGGVALEHLVSAETKRLTDDHRSLAIILVALVGAGFHGFILGRWQWRVLARRLVDLKRRQWVVATFVPAVFVWLLAIAPAAVDAMALGGDTLSVFRNGFTQALVLGPLIGLSQATALRDDTTRWKWWFAANVSTYLIGAAAYELGKWILGELSLSREVTPAFPILGFVVYGVWMLWVTAPEATEHARLPSAPADAHTP